MVQFSEEFKAKVLSARRGMINDNNTIDVVKGLLYDIAQKEFDEKRHKEFNTRLLELIEEYGVMQQKISSGLVDQYPEDVVQGIKKINSYLANIVSESKKPQINEKVMVNYLRALASDSNELEKRYPKIMKLLKEKHGILTRLNRIPAIKKLLITIGIFSASQQSVGESTSEMNKNQTAITAPAPSQNKATPDSTYTKAWNLNTAPWNFNSATNDSIMNAEAKKQAATDSIERDRQEKFMSEYNKVLKNRKEVVEQVDIALAKLGSPISYISIKHIKALIWQESRFNPHAVSEAGASGLTQVMEDSWTGGDYSNNRFDIYRNIKEGLKVLKQKERYCRKNHPNWKMLTDDQKIAIIFASYNWGEGNVKNIDWDMARLGYETRTHLDVINDFLKRA